MAGMASSVARVGRWAHRTWAAVRATKRGRRISTTIIVLILAVGVLQLWTWWPDTLRITVTQRTGDGHSYVIYDHTIHDAAQAQRLQRDLAGIPIPLDLLAVYSCSENSGTYTLQWSRFGLPTETATMAGCASMWTEDGVLPRVDRTQQGILPDLDKLGVPQPVPSWQLAQP